MALAWWGALVLAAAAAAWRLLRDDAPSLLGRRGARFAGRADLRRLRRGRDAWFPLGYAGPRGVARALVGRRSAPLRRLLCGPLLRLPNAALARHVLVVGLTGAGKTSTVTMPVLLEAARHGVSAVVFDLKYGEDDTLASAAVAWQRADRDVCVFAPLEAASLCWNPLDGCRTIAAAQRIATMLFEEPRDGSPDLGYWAGVERHVCATLIYAVASDGGAALDRVRALSAAGPDAVRAYVHEHAGAELLERHLGAYRTMLPKDQAGILQGIASRLDAWSDPAVCAATRAAPPHRRLPLDRLRREPILLIVGIPQSALERCHWLWRLFLRDLNSLLLRPRASDERVPVLAVFEELPAWGALPAFAEHLATLRSRGVAIMATIQSEAQGEHVYGRAGWAAVAANLVTKIYLAPLADGDAERLSRTLGLTGVPDVRQNSVPRTSGKAPYRGVIGVPLCSPQELQGVDAASHETLVRSAGVPPARLWCPPYYRRPEYLGLVPARPPSTAEITVYHDLRSRRLGAPPGEDPAHRQVPPETPMPPDGRQDASPLRARATAWTQARSAGTGQSGASSVVGATDRILPSWSPSVAATVKDRRALPGSAAGTGQSGASSVVGATDRALPSRSPSVTATPEDRSALREFVQAALAVPPDGDRRSVRAVWRAGRLVTLRVDSSVAASAAGGAETMQARVRRWAELGWVRRVRPVLVLERRAIEAAGPLQFRAECVPTTSGDSAAGSCAEVAAAHRVPATSVKPSLNDALPADAPSECLS